MVDNPVFDASRPQSMTAGLHRLGESGNVSAVGQVETEPCRRVPWHWCTRDA